MSSTPCWLRLVRYDPPTQAWRPLPDRCVVRAWDADPLTPDDPLGEARIEGGQGIAMVPVGTDGVEARPELYFTVELPPGDPTQTWSSRDVDGTDHARGLCPSWQAAPIGSAEHPWTFRVGFEAFVRFVYWDEAQGDHRPVPAGSTVTALQHHKGEAQPMAEATTDADGAAHLHIPHGLRWRPDLSFSVRLADPPPGLPLEWSSKAATDLDRPDRSGYFADYAGSRIGLPRSPAVFDISADLRRARPGHRVAALVDGTQLWPRLQALLRSAQHSIHLEVMLFYNDPIGREVLDLLIERARAGVQVRLMFDVRTTASSVALIYGQMAWVGALTRTPAHESVPRLAELAKAVGPEIERGDTTAMRARLATVPNLRFVDSSKPYVEVDPAVSALLPAAYRQIEAGLPFFTVGRVDHRKMCLIDGRVGLLGGQNIGSEYLYPGPLWPGGAAPTERRWHDCFVEVEGPVLTELQELFRQRWMAEGGDAFDRGPRRDGDPMDAAHPTFPSPQAQQMGCMVEVVSTTPGTETSYHRALLGLLQGAKARIWLENPYISGDEVTAALCAAAQRGVQVRCIFPGDANDSLEFLYNARMKYLRLIGAGVQVYEYQGPMTHAKVGLVDNTALIGSGNLNHASFFNHYEVGLLVHDAAFAASFGAALFETDLGHSLLITSHMVPDMLNLTLAGELFLRGVVDELF